MNKKMILQTSIFEAIIMLSFCGCGIRTMKAPNLYAKLDVDPFSNVEPHFQDNKVDVLYITDRNILEDKKGKTNYGFNRSTSMAYGSFVVEFGDQLSWDDFRVQSLDPKFFNALLVNTYNITEHGRFPDTPLPLVEINNKLVEEPETKADQLEMESNFQKEIQRRLALTTRKEAYIYIHGYHSPFEDSSYVIAQLWHFMGRQGIPIAYSWPAGKPTPLRGYQYDRESGEFTLFHLKGFLKMLSSCPDLEKIHIVSHSRGTDVAISALRELFIEANAAGINPAKRYKFGNVILAAPDLDIEVAVQRIAAERFHRGLEKLTIYVSKHDRAIGISKWLFSSKRRLGQLQTSDLSQGNKVMLKTINQTDIIDANVNVGFTGHYYFYLSPAVSSDLILILRDNLKPGKENGRPLIQIGPNFWQIDKDYLINSG
jgi:esterase/lipase superfamily enzyme